MANKFTSVGVDLLLAVEAKQFRLAGHAPPWHPIV